MTTWQRHLLETGDQSDRLCSSCNHQYSEFLKTNLSLDSNLGTPYVFIIDRDSNLRGRDDDDGVKYGYDSRSVADINNNMLDDVKVILAEYRMALKKNNRYKENLD